MLAQANQTNLILNVDFLLTFAEAFYFPISLTQLLVYPMKLILDLQTEMIHSV